MKEHDIDKYDLTELKELLKLECSMKPSEETLDSLLAMGKVRHYRTNEVITEAGVIETNIFIVKKGVICGTDLNGSHERAIGFGEPGTIFINRFSFVMNQPSYMELRACCPTDLIAITQTDITRWLETSSEGYKWFFYLAMTSLYNYEDMKSKVLNGTAEEQFLNMVRFRPYVVNNVSQRAIASYLNITPQHLSRLKRQLLYK